MTNDKQRSYGITAKMQTRKKKNLNEHAQIHLHMSHKHIHNNNVKVGAVKRLLEKTVISSPKAFHKCNLKNAEWSWIENQLREDNTIDQLIPNNQYIWLQGKHLNSGLSELHLGKLASVAHSTERKALNWIGQESR